LSLQHTAPQHRQYLNFDGVGYGTPRQRQNQYQKYRAAVAIDNLYDHRVNKLKSNSVEDALIIKDKKAAKQIKTR
jgi:DnaJ family protein C protein 28